MARLPCFTLVCILSKQTGSYGILQLFIWNGSVWYWQSGQWNEMIFIGMPHMYEIKNNGPTPFQNRERTAWFMWSFETDGYLRIWLDLFGHFKQMDWNEERGMPEWDPVLVHPSNPCNAYRTCGPFGIRKPWCLQIVAVNLNSSMLKSGIKGTVQVVLREELNWIVGGMAVELPCIWGERRRVGVVRFEVADVSVWMPQVAAIGCEAKCVYISWIGCMVWRGDLIDIQDSFEEGWRLRVQNWVRYWLMVLFLVENKTYKEINSWKFMH